MNMCLLLPSAISPSSKANDNNFDNTDNFYKAPSFIRDILGIQTRAARGFAIPSSCGGLDAFGAWPPAAATADLVARFARHFLIAEQPIMKALKYPSNLCD